jgi:iron complex outermembrane receptor protein
VFGELTAHLTSAWSVTGGTRLFKQTLSQSQQTGLLFDGPISIANNSLSDSWRRALWKINTSYQLDQTNLVYATWSQGFRRGSVNALPPSEPAVGYTTNPGLYRVTPDTANNYEVGFKGTVANRFRYSADVFDIQWHNVQEGAQLTPLVLPGAINVGNAYSRGVEAEMFFAVDRHLSAQVDYTYDQTKLTSYNALVAEGLSVPPPPVGGPMPGTPKNSAAVTLTYGNIMIANGEMRYSVSAHYQSPGVARALRDDSGRSGLHDGGYALELHVLALRDHGLLQQSHQQSGYQLVLRPVQLQSAELPGHRLATPDRRCDARVLVQRALSARRMSVA